MVVPEIFEMFPNYIRGVVISRDIDNHGEKEELSNLLREAEHLAT
jgi:hypothetical protein